MLQNGGTMEERIFLISTIIRFTDKETVFASAQYSPRQMFEQPLLFTVVSKEKAKLSKFLQYSVCPERDSSVPWGPNSFNFFHFFWQNTMLGPPPPVPHTYSLLLHQISLDDYFSWAHDTHVINLSCGKYSFEPDATCNRTYLWKEYIFGHQKIPLLMGGSFSRHGYQLHAPDYNAFCL